MKITIDTREDSHDDLKKVIELLSKFLNQSSIDTAQFNPEASNLMSMFNDEPQAPQNLAPPPSPESTASSASKSTPSIEWY